MPEGLQDKTGSNKKYFKLMEDKRTDSKTLKQYRFFQNEKVNGNWVTTNEGNSMSGTVVGINIKTYKWEGQDKEQMEIELAGKESNYVIAFGLNTQIADNLINTLANEPIIGEIELNCGFPNKEGYPTLYINHNGQKTKWKYSKENNNWDEIPKITKENIEGTIVKRGQTAKTDFWKKVLAEQVIPKLAPLKDVPPISENKIAGNEGVNVADDIQDLPF